MTNERLFDMPLLPHLVIDGLNRYDDRPFLFLGDATITYAQVRADTSRFAQAYESKGIKKGSRTAVLSANRPEVLYNLCANMVVGSCNTPLHPLGSAETKRMCCRTPKSRRSSTTQACLRRAQPSSRSGSRA